MSSATTSPSTPFPTTLADLQPNFDADASFYHTLRRLRRSTLSVRNRLSSILHDAAFAQSVAAKHALALIANERCGSWYIPPTHKAGSAYFKSTDGHHGQWDFSLRRLNLELARILGEGGGAVLVDSTRRGKSVPDALAKTVPVWVSVVNRVCWPEQARWAGLQCRKGEEGLGESEVSQIEGRIEGFVERFRGLGIDVEELKGRLKRPVRIMYEVNGVEGEERGEEGWDMVDDIELDAGVERDYSLLVLCSVSRRVRGAEISEGGYIQGAGDDSESWSFGLTPELFWANKDMLMAAPEEELPEMIRVLKEGEMSGKVEQMEVLIGPTKGLFIAAQSTTRAKDASTNFDLVINCSMKDPSDSHNVLHLSCRTGKLGSRDLRGKLTIVKSFVGTALERNPGCRILITCENGKDLAAGVAVTLLCLFFDASGIHFSSVGLVFMLVLIQYRCHHECFGDTPS